MFQEVLVVALGKVEAAVSATAFVAGESGAGNEQTGQVKVCGLMGAARDGMVQLRRQFFKLEYGVAQTLGIAQHAYVLPHGVLNLPDERFHGAFFPSVSSRVCGILRAIAGNGTKFSAHGASGAGSEDQAFKKGIAGQAVCAMHAGRGRFSGGVEAGKIGFAFKIGAHSAHGIVRRRANRN